MFWKTARLRKFGANFIITKLLEDFLSLPETRICRIHNSWMDSFVPLIELIEHVGHSTTVIYRNFEMISLFEQFTILQQT